MIKAAHCLYISLNCPPTQKREGVINVIKMEDVKANDMWGEITGARLQGWQTLPQVTLSLSGMVERCSASHLKERHSLNRGNLLVSPKTSWMKPLWLPVLLNVPDKGSPAYVTGLPSAWSEGCSHQATALMRRCRTWPKSVCRVFFLHRHTSVWKHKGNEQWLTDYSTAVKDNSYECTNYLIIMF